MPRGASPKREHEFEKLKHQFQHDHRYPGREEEVAARIVNKQRTEAGETKSSSGKSAKPAGSSRASTRQTSRTSAASRKSANAHTGNPRLSIKEYAGLTIPEVTSRLATLTLSQIRRLRDYELAHKHRKGMLEKLNRKLVH